MTTLLPGQQLLPGQSLQSKNGLHTFILQRDGNAVLYDRYSQPLWSTKTGGLIEPRNFIMQTDGNLVLYSTDGQAPWASNTYNNPGAFFDIQDDGNLVVYRAGSQTETADNALWAAGSNDPWNLAGTWTPLTNQPTFNASTMLLLTDGTVLCQNSGASDWWKLTPDQSGNYVTGTWSALASGPNSPLYYASAVLRDGRVFVAGGEYNAGESVDLLAAQIYNPETNTWTPIGTPDGWTHIGDAPSCVLPDGRILVGSILDTRTAIYDPVTNTWTAGPNKGDASSEETWTLLPDGTVLVIQCSAHPQTEKFVIAADTWVTAGSTPSDLVEAASIETGPCLLLTDGRVFAIGATGHTALYTFPPIANQTGSWVAGPDFPMVGGQTVGAKDSPGCLLPNGRVLCAVGPVDGVSGDYLSPTYFFEFDPASSNLTAVTNPPTSGGPPFVGRMLLLPSGQVIFANESNNIQVYTPDGGPDPAWKPSITSCPISLQRNHTYTLSGRQLNGLSQAVSYGDDAQMATNYPLVRITNLETGHVFYCRTHDHSTMSVHTGMAVHSTMFDVPVGIETGASELSVIANGISSDSIAVTVGL